MRNCLEETTDGRRSDLHRVGLAVNNIAGKLSYEIEAISELTATFVVGVDYGIIEAKWIPTESLGLPLLGRFSYYHVGLLVLMLVVGTALAWSHLQWIIKDRKKYILYVCAAALPLSLMIEDATWFATRSQPIGYDEWTMIRPGWGINLGFTWLPFWYIGTLAWSVLMLYLSGKYADRGYRAYLNKRTLSTRTVRVSELARGTRIPFHLVLGRTNQVV
jgi:hypothetical protein